MKKFHLWCLLAAVTILLNACAGGQPESTVPETQKPETVRLEIVSMLIGAASGNIPMTNEVRKVVATQRLFGLSLFNPENCCADLME